MSVSIRCQLVLGFAFLESELKVARKVRGCLHAETNQPFCAQCGRPMWDESEDQRELLLEDRKFEEFLSNTRDFQHIEENNVWVVGVKVPTDARGCVKLESLDESPESIEARLFDQIENIGLNPVGKFGLHLVRYIG